MHPSTASRWNLPVRWLTALGLALCLPIVAQAQPQTEFVVSFGPPTHIVQGGTGFVPVFVTPTTTATLDLDGFQFQLLPFMGRMAQFLPSPAPTSDPTFANPTYLFAPPSVNSSDFINGNPLAPTVTTITNPNDSIIGGDSTPGTFPTPDITVIGGTTYLLGDLLVSAGNGMPGDIFPVDLVPPAGISFTTPPGNTGFTNQTGTLYPFVAANAGAVIIDAAAPIPEPSTVVISLVCGLAALPSLRRRWKQRAAAVRA